MHYFKKMVENKIFLRKTRWVW